MQYNISFTVFVNEDDNQFLMDIEVHDILHSFQKDKSLSSRCGLLSFSLVFMICWRVI